MVPGDVMFSARLKALRQQAGLSQAEIAKKIFISQPAYSKYEVGTSTPNPDTLAALAKVLNTSVDYLIGGETSSPNAIRLNVLGSVPAGKAIEAIEDIVDWEEIPAAMAAGGKEFFALQVKGDSMWPDYLEGDVVIVQKTPVCQTGDICVVYVNGYDATLKQVKLNPEEQSLTLIPRNPSYPPRTFSAQEIAELPVSIAGKVVELRRKIK